MFCLTGAYIETKTPPIRWGLEKEDLNIFINGSKILYRIYQALLGSS